MNITFNKTQTAAIAEMGKQLKISNVEVVQKSLSLLQTILRYQEDNDLAIVNDTEILTRIVGIKETAWKLE